MSWKTIKSEKKADFPLFKVYEDLVELPNKLTLDYYWVDKIPAVVVLPISPEGIILVKQYRYPLRKESLELPAGHMNKNETPKECAIRELKEETGYSAKKIEKILSYNPSTEYSTQTYHIYLAQDLTKGETNREKYELMELEIMDTHTIFEKIKDGSIFDGRTITALLLARYLGKL